MAKINGPRAALASAALVARRLARAALIAYLFVVLMFSAFERWLVFPAPPHNGADWVAAELPHEDVYFDADDGTKLHGWYVPHPAPRAVGAVLARQRRARRPPGARRSRCSAIVRA